MNVLKAETISEENILFHESSCGLLAEVGSRAGLLMCQYHSSLGSIFFPAFVRIHRKTKTYE